MESSAWDWLECSLCFIYVMIKIDIEKKVDDKSNQQVDTSSPGLQQAPPTRHPGSCPHRSVGARSYIRLRAHSGLWNRSVFRHLLTLWKTWKPVPKSNIQLFVGNIYLYRIIRKLNLSRCLRKFAPVYFSLKKATKNANFSVFLLLLRSLRFFPSFSTLSLFLSLFYRSLSLHFLFFSPW